MLHCFVCGKEVKEEDDVFEQFVVTTTTMCKECKGEIEKKALETHSGVSAETPADDGGKKP